MRKIRTGNTIDFRYRLYRADGEGKVPEDLTGITIAPILKNKYFGNVIDITFETSGNEVSASIPGMPVLKAGIYNFALFFSKGGYDYAIDIDAFEIVDSSSKTGGTACCPEMEVNAVELSGTIDSGSTGGEVTEQVQADWNEKDASSKAFIKNKPELKAYILDIDADKAITPEAASAVIEAFSAGLEILVRFTPSSTLYKPTSIAKGDNDITLFLHEAGNTYMVVKLTPGTDIADVYSKYISQVEDKLDSTSTAYALSSNQGRVLNEKIGDISLLLDEINGEVI